MSCIGFSAYAITHRESGSVYIGATTICVTLRYRRHLQDAQRGATSSDLHIAIRKFGATAFDFKQIASAKCWRDLTELERCLIEQYDSFCSGYNMTNGSNAVMPSGPRMPHGFSSRRDLAGRVCKCARYPEFKGCIAC